LVSGFVCQQFIVLGCLSRKILFFKDIKCLKRTDRMSPRTQSLGTGTRDPPEANLFNVPNCLRRSLHTRWGSVKLQSNGFRIRLWKVAPRSGNGETNWKPDRDILSVVVPHWFKKDHEIVLEQLLCIGYICKTCKTSLVKYRITIYMYQQTWTWIGFTHGLGWVHNFWKIMGWVWCRDRPNIGSGYGYVQMCRYNI
jgi:hypothetical protein